MNVKIQMGVVELPNCEQAETGTLVAEGARAFGLLAVHRGLRPDGTPCLFEWVVTHIPTGYAVMKVYTKRHAFAAARALQHLPWQEIVTAKKAKRWKHSPEAVRIMKELRAKWAPKETE